MTVDDRRRSHGSTRAVRTGPPMSRREFIGRAAVAGAAGTTLLQAVLSGQSRLYAASPSRTVNIEVDAGQNENPFRWNTPAMQKKWGFDTKLIGLPFVGQYEKLVSELTARSAAYDVLVFPPYFLGDFVSLNFLRDLDQYKGLGDPGLAEYLPAYREPVVQRNGKTYALMYDGDLLQITYRKDLFENPKERDAFKSKYGHELAPPKTWDEYMQIAEFFQRPPNLYGTAFYADRGFCYAWFANIFAALGGKWFASESDLTPGINSDVGVKALQMMVKMKDFAPPNILQIDYPTLNAVFLNGSTAMVVQWDDLPLKVENPAMSKVVGKGGYAPCPVRSYMPYSRVMAVSAFSRNPENAYRLAWYMQLPQVSITYVYDPECGQDPYRESQLKYDAVKNHLGKPTMSAAAARNYVDAIREGLKTGYPELSIPGAPRYLDILDLYVNQALAGSLPPKAALDAAAREWKSITEAEDPARQKAAYAAWIDAFRKAGVQY
jgi:multiple sugar transport system substrate-binding protein